MQFQYVMLNNKALIHLNYQWLHSLQSAIPINKTCKKWDMTLSPLMAIYSVMRDICENGTNRKRMSCLLHTGHIQILMGLWIWITFFDTHCIPQKWSLTGASTLYALFSFKGINQTRLIFFYALVPMVIFRRPMAKHPCILLFNTVISR